MCPPQKKQRGRGYYGFFLLLLCCLISPNAIGQSLELMVGQQSYLADIQWLKPLDQKFRFTLFSRTRATVDYEQKVDLFTGAYANYTTKYGMGASLVGKISQGGSTAEVGIHFYKAQKNWMLFGLAALALKNDWEYNWFSILRFTPSIHPKWQLYTSLELYGLFQPTGLLYGVQRIRLGLKKDGYQFGIANNITEFRSADILIVNPNWGLFIRKTF